MRYQITAATSIRAITRVIVWRYFSTAGDSSSASGISTIGPRKRSPPPASPSMAFDRGSIS